ncbi:U6 snRNA-associated Sm-like protein LSm7 isoform X3 [Desmodus rotundus]|uniref:U6 snRNA-associated Sm-like protein LSm7 isoform X3 n=1 Tax=Desmodus rotundus TaxID=9430 RepID=UPI0023815F84|nr:U6 snRNA-associated Sm-like protein LSm7 isoform X2 [Desmodus rotundus]
MLAGRRRRQMFPSNAPARRAAQAPCLSTLAYGVGSKSAEAAPAQRGKGRCDKMADKEKKKKESILDLSKYIDKTIRVKFQGGREGCKGTCCSTWSDFTRLIYHQVNCQGHSPALSSSEKRALQHPGPAFQGK